MSQKPSNPNNLPDPERGDLPGELPNEQPKRKEPPQHPHEDAPVVRLVNVLMVDSLRRGASDIHVEPYERDFRIRFRIDGVLFDIYKPPKKLQ